MRLLIEQNTKPFNDIDLTGFENLSVLSFNGIKPKTRAARLFIPHKAKQSQEKQSHLYFDLLPK